jgi:hypothetical protein
MKNHYFVTASLPALTWGQPPEISFSDLLTLLRENLSVEELASVQVVRGLVDLYNLAAFLRGEELDRRGSFTAAELEEMVKTQEGLRPYVLEFLERYETTEARLRRHGELVVTYFQREIEKAKGFLRRYLEFERQWRLVMVGLRASRLDRDLATELQWEDPADPLVAQLLMQRDVKSFEPPEPYQPLKPIFQEHETDPWGLEMALEQFRFEQISEMVETEAFSLDFILGYMVQLMIIEKWQDLHDKQHAAGRA